jgi:hypothetical protein
LDGKWVERLKSKTRQLQQERDELAQNTRQQAVDMQQSNTVWSESLTAVLASTVTGEDIPSNFLHLVLPHPFSSMRTLSWKPVSPYVFAEVYTGLGEDCRLPEEDLRMADLLCWTIGTSLPRSIPVDALHQIVWLETDLLKKIRNLEKRDSWVLLAFRLLFKMVVSSDWPACCIAAVRLAVLARQYPMYNQNEWDGLVAGLLNQYIQLDIDPLGQACLAYLCRPPAILASRCHNIFPKLSLRPPLMQKCAFQNLCRYSKPTVQTWPRKTSMALSALSL